MKPLTFAEACERLQRWDEVTLLEFLGLTTEDLIGAFAEKIEERLEAVNKELDDFDE